MFKLGFVLLIPALVASSPAAAAISDCDSALIVATYNSVESSKSDWRMAKYVNEATYNQIKHDASATGAIYGVPVGASYSDFQENMKQFTNSQSESLTEQQFRNISWTGLDPSAAQAYQACIKGQGHGLALIPVGATDSDISFRLSYSSIGGSANPLPIKWSGAEASRNQLPPTAASGDGATIIINRPEKTSTLAVNSSDGSGFSDSVVLTPLPKEDPSEKFATRCTLRKGPTGSVTRGKSFSWNCPRLRAGTYSADIVVVPTTTRPVRISWSAKLDLDSNQSVCGQNQRSWALQTTSGAVIDASANGSGLANAFESHGNRITVSEVGTLPTFTINVDNTAWHGDFSQPSDDPVFMPSDVLITMERL